MSADRNLLFGVLALQLDFISRDQLIAGMQTWVNDKGKPLAQILEATGALDATNRQLLEPLVERHIQQHGNDPQQSLAMLSSADRLCRELAEIQDADVQQSLVSLGQTLPLASADPHATMDPTMSLGVHTSAGTRFRILRPHARGGLGEVFVARDTELGREVALKEIQHDKSYDPDARARFTREAEITGGLEHPGIVPVYGLGAYPDGRPFYAMRFIRGKSLHDAIKAYHSKEKTSPTEQNLELRRLLQRFIDVCEAIDYAHSRGVLHRDLKPGNIMLGRYGETLVVDWGLAKALGETPKQPPATSEETKDPSVSQLPEPPLIPGSHGSSGETMLGSALGTIAYMSPEQANGRWDLLGPESDVFSLGATLFHLLTGQPPYTGNRDEAYAHARAGEYPRPRSITRIIPVPLEAICLKALAPRPENRYPSAQAFAQDLERYLADEPIAALTDTLLTRASRWTRQHRHWMQAGGLALLLVAITAIGAYFYQRETALQNQRLAEEKGNLANEKSKLASDNLRLAQESQAKANSLRSAMAEYYFAHGLNEYATGNLENGVIDLQRATAMLLLTDPRQSRYEQVLLDRAMFGGRGSVPMRHDSGIRAVGFSPEGDRVLTGGFDKTARIWNAQTCGPVGKPLVHDGQVTSVSFSPKGDRVLTGSEDKTARIWDVRTGTLLGEPLRHDHFVVAVAFSPQGDRVLTGSYDKTARLWDARTGAPLGEPMRHEGWVEAVAFSPQGDRVLTGSNGKTARLWDAWTGASVSEPLHGGTTNVAFSPQGDRVLTGSYDKTSRLWDARTGAPLGEPMRHEGWVAAVAFSPEGDRVLTGSEDKTARLWDARTVTPLGQPLRHDALVRSMAFSPQGDRIVTASDDGNAQIWDARTGSPLGEPLRHDNNVLAVAFSPQGDRVLTLDGTARIWDARTGTSFGEPLRHTNPVRAVAFSPEGDRVLTGSSDAAQVWDAQTAAPLGNPLWHDASVGAVAFSSRWDRVLTGSWDKTARLWDARTGAPLGEPMRHEDIVAAVAFSPEGDRVLTGSHDRTARLWNARTGAPLGEPLRHSEWVWSVAFSPNGDRVLTGSWDNTARLWDAATGAPLGEPLRHEGPVNAVAFSPEGDRVLTGSMKIGRLWDARTGMPLGEPLRHSTSVQAVAFSPKGDRVLTGSSDKAARLWDARTGAALGESMQHEGEVFAVAFSPQGDRVLTGSEDKTARLWDVSVLKPTNVAAYATLITGFEVDRDGNAKSVNAVEMERRREWFYGTEGEWIAASAKRREERQRRYLHQRLGEALDKEDLFIAYQSARFLSAEELAKVDSKSLKLLAIQVLVVWFRDGKLDQVAGAIAESAEVPEAGAGKVLKTLKEAIPVLYWETDERLGRLGNELERLAAEAGPAK